MMRVLCFLVLSVLSWVVTIGAVVAACFTFFPSPSNAGVEFVSALAGVSALGHLASVAIAIARFILRMSLYRPIVIRPRKYY